MMRFLLLLCLLAGSFLLPVRSYGQLVTLGDDNYSMAEDSGPVTYNDILNNDSVFPLGAIDPSTVDLDVIALGIQNTATTTEGEWSVDDSGVLTFNPIPNFNGDAAIDY